jgi:hypothetical protein
MSALLRIRTAATLFMELQKNMAWRMNPFPITAENFDDAKRRLGQILEAGLEPRVPGLLFPPNSRCRRLRPASAGPRFLRWATSFFI